MHRYITFLASSILAVSLHSVSGAGVLEGLYRMPTTTFRTAPYTYLSFNSVAALDQDMKILLARLASETPDGFLAAQRVFEKGAYSESFAVFEISDVNFVNLDIPAGIVDGKTASGADIRGISHYGSPFGNSTLTVHYPLGGTSGVTDEDMVTGTLQDMGGGGAKCHVGGNPSPVTDGCFAATGSLKILDSLTFDYTYDPLRDNGNGLSLATLVADRNVPGDILPKYVNYYGKIDYDTTWIRAAFAGIKTPGFTNGVTSTDMDFSQLTVEGRHAAVRWGLVVLRVWMFFANSLEEAIRRCATSTDDALVVWDRAVAAFAGSGPIAERPVVPEDGYFLYNLIEIECIKFGTCEPTDPMAPLNTEILELMDSARKSLSVGECPSVTTKTKRIIELVTIPLIQGILRNAYALDLNDNTQGWTQGQVAAYAAAVAPLLHDCNQGNAFVIIDDLAAGKAPGASFEVIKATLERSYSCLRITCEDINGLRAVNSDDFEKGAEPCSGETPAGGGSGIPGSAYTDPSVQAPTPALPFDDDPPGYEVGSNPGSIPALPSIPTPSPGMNNNPNKKNDWKAGTVTNLKIEGLGQSDVVMISVSIVAFLIAAVIAITYCCWDAKQTKQFDTAASPGSPQAAAAAAAVETGAVEGAAETNADADTFFDADADAGNEKTSEAQIV